MRPTRESMYIAWLLANGWAEQEQELRYRVFSRPDYMCRTYVRKDGTVRIGPELVRSQVFCVDWEHVEREYAEVAKRNHTGNQSPYPSAAETVAGWPKWKQEIGQSLNPEGQSPQGEVKP